MIKNYSRLLLAALFLFCFTGFSQTNLITNGDFENWTGNEPNNWTTTIGSVFRIQSDASSGSSSTQIFNATTSQDARIESDSYSLIGGKTYLLRVNVKMTFVNGSSTQDIPSINVRVNRENGPDMGYSDWHQTDTWEDVQIAFEVTENDIYSFEFTIANSSIRSQVQDILIDNVRLFDESEVPENNIDRNALIALYNATDGPNWQNTWDLNESMIYWDGISQNDNGRVTKIKLRANNLIGFLPAELGDLEELQILDLTKNGFSGQLVNNLSGIIPPEIGNLTKLKEIYLSSFELSGNLPPEMGQMTQLEFLFLSYNKLTGNIPSQFGNLTSLKRLVLNSNELTGELPNEIGQLHQLETITLDNNDLTGPIPTSIGQMTNLNYLDFSRNSLTGGIPIEIGQLQNLKTLNLGQNNLGGTIPPQLSQLSTIENLYLDRNGLTGSLPIEFSQLINLERLGLESNSLTGQIPVEYGTMTNLIELDLGFNQLSGSLPSSLGQLSNLVTLFLSRNNLSGNIPTELTQIPTLSRLQLDRNNLNGDVPTFSTSFSIFGLYSNSFVFENLKSASSNQTAMSYSPQNDVSETETISVEENQTFSISVTETTDPDNIYQWRKNGEIIDGATNSSFIITNVIELDAGTYDCLINNTVLTLLELTKKPITLEFVYGDSDNDGVSNNMDNCPNTLTGETVDTNGCSQSQLDDDNDGVNNNLDQCPNTPTGTNVDSQGCLITIVGQTNFLQNFSFENWSGNPLTPDNWSIANANSIIRNNEATEGNYSLEIDLNNSLQFKTELQNTATIQLATNTTYTYSFDYKIKRGDNVSAEIQISKDGNPFGIRIADEFVGFESDGAWHTISFEFDTNDIDEDHIFKLVIRANTSITGIIQIDNMRVLGEALADADNDGVLDSNDQCPNTPSTALAVDDNGCEIIVNTSNLIVDPSFEDWSLNSGTNLSSWGRNLIPGSSWNKNEDINDNLEFSLEQTTGDNGSNSASVFQNDIELYDGVEYIISIDYKVIAGTFNSLELELTTSFFETYQIFTIDPIDQGWQTLTRTFTADSNALVDLRVAVVSAQAQERILLDNMVLRVNTTIIDADNDGVEDANDNCPNTPAGETVNTQGCTITDVADTDNDGVLNTDDDCPNTPTGDSVDANGCTVTTTTDSDNDGVKDVDDNCPNTPAGETVNAQGCAIDQNPLPEISNDGIQVKVTSTSCPDTTNGEISVSFDQDHNYTVQITGLILDNTFSNISSTNGFVRSDLTSGTYTVCVTIPEFPSFKQCFSATVETPEEFISGKTVIDYTALKASVVVSGSKNYEVLVNDKIYSFQFDNAANQQLTFPLNKGTNAISIETDKICQGVYNDSVIVNNAILSPNPVADVLKVEGLESMGNAQIIISNLNGTTALLESRQITSGTLEINISNLSPGIYLLTITNGEKEINLKFVKK